MVTIHSFYCIAHDGQGNTVEFMIACNPMAKRGDSRAMTADKLMPSWVRNTHGIMH